MIDKSESVDMMCECLGLKLEDARSALCQRKIKAGLDTLSVPKSKEEALNSRDAVARVIYTRMFDWMIGVINTSLQVCPMWSMGVVCVCLCHIGK